MAIENTVLNDVLSTFCRLLRVFLIAAYLVYVSVAIFANISVTDSPCSQRIYFRTFSKFSIYRIVVLLLKFYLVSILILISHLTFFLPIFYCCPENVICFIHMPHYIKGARWLSGRVFDSRPKGRGFGPHRRHCVVSLSKTHISLLSTCSTQEDPSLHN